MAEDRTPQDGRGKRSEARGGASRAGGAAGSRQGAAGGGKRGRTRPPTQVVAQQRPWGLIAAALAVVVFAAAVITYAVVRVNRADAARIDSVDEINGVQTYDYSAGQEHVDTPVDYTESPPVGGPHAPPPAWADCTGTVYDVDVRHENAVHSLEHGAVWITYDPDQVSGDDVATLAKLVTGVNGRMLSPYAGLDSPVSVQSWNHQLKVDSAADPRIEQFADFLTLNADFYPEVGASCENPGFVADPAVAGDAGAAAAASTGADGGATPSSPAP